MGDTNKMEKIPLNSYDVYSDRELLDKRSFPDWINSNKEYLIPQQSKKRAKFGNEVMNIGDETNFEPSLSERKDSHKSFYIEPTINRRQIQKLSPYCSLNNMQVKSLEEFYSSINSLIKRVSSFPMIKV